MTRLYALALIAAAFLAATATAALADGMLFPVERPHSTIVVPDQLFTVRYHHVNVTIEDQLCTTKVDQIFHNDAGVDREGIYVFPMPEGSAITKFSMYAGEEEIVGKILTKEEARGIYESIVRRRKDPALLEYIDRNTFRASVYPIPAHGDKRIRLNYAEVASRSGSACRYVYPLSTERFSARPLEDCKVTIKIKTKRPITNIYSPTHAIDIDRDGDYAATVTWEAKDVKPDTDLVLYYSVGPDDIGIDLVAHRERGVTLGRDLKSRPSVEKSRPSVEKGFYMLLASPRIEVDRSKILPKNVVFVLDRTGSMAGEKIDQAKDALKFCLSSLRDNDQFNLITFNESSDALFAELEKPTAERRKKANDAIDDVDATGGTNINEALTKALAQFRQYGKTRNYIVFLTDGQPTVGVTDLEKILTNTGDANENKVKVFVFGVGYDVNVHLLDKLAEQSRGDADYVRPKENIEVKVSSFFAKVSDPLLADVKLTVTGVKTSDAFPSGDLPDIFRGSQLLVFGRYDGSGPVKVELSGVTNGSRKTFRLEGSLPEREESNEFIPQLWAARKIGYLLDEIRLHKNQELIDEVVRLSKEYGIPTEFTSFLADERGGGPIPLGAEVKRAGEMLDAAGKVQTGTHGVAQSANSRDLKNQAQLPQAGASSSYYGHGGYAGGAGSPTVIGKVAGNQRLGGVYYDANDRAVVMANVQNVARRTFYQRGDYWEDAAVKPSQSFVQIKQFSDAHFRLLKAYPRLTQYSTLGNVRLVLENSQAIEIGPSGKDQLTDKEIYDLLKGVRRT